MDSKASYILAGYHTATPYLITKNAAAAMEFYKAAFGAHELELITDDNGAIRHVEFKIGDSPFMMTEEHPDFPQGRAPSRVAAHQYTFIFTLKMQTRSLTRQFRAEQQS